MIDLECAIVALIPLGAVMDVILWTLRYVNEAAAWAVCLEGIT